MKSPFKFKKVGKFKYSIKNLIMISMMVISILLVIVVWIHWYFYEQAKFNLEYAKVENIYFNNYKKLVKREVERAVSHINYTRSMSKDNLMNDLAYRVDIAYDIANNIYEKNKGRKTENEIKEIIIEALRYNRTGHSKEYVFIYTLDGTSVLLPDRPQDEGQASVQFTDHFQNLVVKKEVNLMKELDRGFLTYKSYDSISQDSVNYKYSYIRKFKPFNWYLGSKVYYADFEKNVQNNILKSLANVRFKYNGYLFVQGTDNSPIISNGTIVKDGFTNFINVDVKERARITKAASNNEEYVKYQYHKPGEKELISKISYISVIESWNWIIGAGFYPEDLKPDIDAQRELLRSNNRKTLFILTCSLFVILLFSFFYIRRVVNRIMADFNKYENAFTKALDTDTVIDEKELKMHEFFLLAESANRMINNVSGYKKALEKEHSFLNSIIDSIPDLIFFKDLQSRYITANVAFCQYLGIDLKDIKGKTDSDLFPSDMAGSYHENDQSIILDGIPIRTEEWVTMPDGSKRLFDTVKVLCQDRDNSILGILCISRDITERQQINEQYLAAKEKAEESDRLKTAFLANMSHEIRTPMNSIVGFSNLIANGGLSDDEQLEYVQYIETSINNLLNIINDIIDIAKIEAGQLTIKPQYVLFSEIIEEVQASITEYKRRMDKPDLDIRFEVDEELKHSKVLVDRYRLAQVINNLLINAVKFTDNGYIEFLCTVEDEYIHFYVKDTGIGISFKDQEILFERFRQVGAKQGYKMGGTGLGLAISKHIVDLMKGEISVKSEPGVGSVFKFTIPYYPDQNHLNKQYNLKSLNLSYVSILVIEDEDVSFNYFKSVMSGTGAQLIRVHNITEAISELSKIDKMHLCYADYDPDELDFGAFIMKLRQKFTELPVIVQINESQKYVAEKFGLSGVVLKPVKYHTLLASIAKTLKKHIEFQ